MSITFNPDGSSYVAAPNGATMAFGVGILPGDISSIMTTFIADNTPKPPLTDPLLLAQIAKLAPALAPPVLTPTTVTTP